MVHDVDVILVVPLTAENVFECRSFSVARATRARSPRNEHSDNLSPHKSNAETFIKTHNNIWR